MNADMFLDEELGHTRQAGGDRGRSSRTDRKEFKQTDTYALYGTGKQSGCIDRRGAKIC